MAPRSFFSLRQQYHQPSMQTSTILTNRNPTSPFSASMRGTMYRRRSSIKLVGSATIDIIITNPVVGGLQNSSEILPGTVPGHPPPTPRPPLAAAWSRHPSRAQAPAVLLSLYSAKVQDGGSERRRKCKTGKPLVASRTRRRRKCKTEEMYNSTTCALKAHVNPCDQPNGPSDELL